MPNLSGSQSVSSNRQNRFLKVSDVALLMDVPTSTVYDLARQKRIGGMIRFGRHIRFDRDVLERWLEQGGDSRNA